MAMIRDREHIININEMSSFRDKYLFGKNASDQGKKDNSFAHDRYSLWNEDDSIENLYGSYGKNASDQGKKDNSLVHDRYSLWKEDNSLENLYDSLGNNASAQGQENDEYRINNKEQQSWNTSLAGDFIPTRGEMSDRQRGSKNIEYRILKNDLRRLEMKVKRYSVALCGSSATFVVKKSKPQNNTEQTWRTQSGNKLAAHSSWLAAQNIRDQRLKKTAFSSFLWGDIPMYRDREGAVANILIPDAYET